jgi:hypothetical protein
VLFHRPLQGLEIKTGGKEEQFLSKEDLYKNEQRLGWEGGCVEYTAVILKSLE